MYKRLLLTGSKPKQQIDRAKAKDTGDDKDNGQNAQGDSREPRKITAEVQKSYYSGNYHSDDTVQFSHIFI